MWVENYKDIEIRLKGFGKEWIVMGKEIVIVVVFECLMLLFFVIFIYCLNFNIFKINVVWFF